MSQLDIHASVGDWVVRHPRTSRVFESLKIDYCCGGGKSLQQACQDRQLNVDEVTEKLAGAISQNDVETTPWAHASLADLCNHIEQTHHAYLKQELPRLTQIITKVAAVHGEVHPELVELKGVFDQLRAELEPHTFKEEQVLFPAIRQLERSEEQPVFPFGTVANPIRMMEQEHDGAGSALARIRELTNDFTVPREACNTYRAMLNGLEELEADMHQHVHKENNILFPRAIELEASRVFAER
jgi:regulator of cell morphogenesis and NO signaling